MARRARSALGDGLAVEETLTDRFVPQDLLMRQAVELMWEYQPAVRRANVIVGHERTTVAFRLVVDRRYADLVREIASAAALQLCEHRLQAAPGIEYVIDDEQLILEREARHQVVYGVDPHHLGLLIDAGVGRGADRDVIGLDAVVLECLLDRNADRCATSPECNQKRRPEAAAHDLHGERDRIA